MALQQFLDVTGNWVTVDVNNPLPITLPSGSNTLTKTSVAANTSTTTVAAGAYSVTFSDLAGSACMIDNVTRAPGNVYVFEASIGKTLPAIQYSTGASSTMTIETLT